jgi:Flp pilus assembly protein TadB
MLHPSPITFWIERCPVCSVTLSGWLCLWRSGYRGFFECPHCESALEVRGRLWLVVWMAIAVIIVGVFTWYFLEFFLHRPIGLWLGFGAAFAFLVFVWVMTTKYALSIGRKDVDATFVL